MLARKKRNNAQPYESYKVINKKIMGAIKILKYVNDWMK
jgi:hypothetical protein